MQNNSILTILAGLLREWPKEGPKILWRATIKLPWIKVSESAKQGK
jgi:hypothetical protein